MGGEAKYSTYFPDDWEREKVWYKIIEAFKDQIKTPVLGKGKIKFYGITSEKIMIEIIVSETTKKLISAFPII